MKRHAVGVLVGITLLALGSFAPADAALCMCHPSSCLLINPDKDALANAENHCPTDKFALHDLMIIRYIESNLTADALVSFPNLTALELFQGALTYIVPGAFEKVPYLLKIIIRNNQIATLEDNTFRGLDGLEVLNIIHSGLSTVGPNAFEGLKNLTELSLAGNKLTRLPESLLASTPALLVINLASNQITDLPAGLFDNLTGLKRLDLSDNRMSSFDIPHLNVAVLLLHNNSLTSLYLSDHLIAVQAEQNRISTLSGTGANLTTLLLSENNITDITALARMPKIAKLSLSSNPLQPNSVFNTLNKLEELLVSHTNIQITEKTFANLTELKLLDLSYNNYTELNFSLFSGLSELQTLIVAFNKIGRINFIEQREFLPKLRVLEICGNGWNATYLENVLSHMRLYRLRADMQGLSHIFLFSSTYVELCSTGSEVPKKTHYDDDYYSEDTSDIYEQDIAEFFPSTSPTTTTSTGGTTTRTTSGPTTTQANTVTKAALPKPSAHPAVQLIASGTDTMAPLEPVPPADKQTVVGSSPLYVTFQVLVYTFSVFGFVCLGVLVYYMRQRRFDVRRVSPIDSADSVRLV